jgi:putative membrane protein (TIGR04086 family)
MLRGTGTQAEPQHKRSECSVGINRLDLVALRLGLTVALAAGLPLGLWLSGLESDSTLRAPLTIGILLALVGGAAVAAARQSRGLPSTHGLVTSLSAVAVVQLVSTIRRWIAADPVSAWKMLSNGLLALIAGVLGGLIGSRMSRQ